MFLENLVQSLRTEFAVVGALTSGAEVAQHAQTLLPDIILLDISLGETNGFDVAAALKKINCPAKLIFISLHENPALVRRAFALGAKGYVFKSRTEDIPTAIRRVLGGGAYSPIGQDTVPPSE